MARLAPHVGRATAIPKRKSTNNADFYGFIAALPCVITKQHGVEVCHLSFAHTKYGHYGRGRGTKAPWRWTLPLRRDLHDAQHNQNEEAFWTGYGIDPHFLSLVLQGLWMEAGMDALGEAESVIRAGDFRV